MCSTKLRPAAPQIWAHQSDGPGGNGGDTGNPNSPGLTFDQDLRRISGSGNQGGHERANITRQYRNYVELWTPISGCNGAYMGSANAGSNTITDSSALNTGTRAAINNSNTNGVLADFNGCPNLPLTPGNDPTLVTNGVELAIPLFVIGAPQGGTISICAFLTDDAYDKLYNQVLGPVTGGISNSSTCAYNLSGSGDSSEVDFQNLPGTHVFTIPVPTCESLQLSFPGGFFPLAASFPSTGGTSNVTVTAAEYSVDGIERLGLGDDYVGFVRFGQRHDRLFGRHQCFD